MKTVRRYAVSFRENLLRNFGRPVDVAALRRRALSFALSAVVISAAALASAEPGTIVLNDGTSVAGEITEIVNGDHLSIRLPNGELRTLAWTQIATMQVGVSGTIVIGPQPAATPAPPPPQPAPPPPVVYAPAPPPPVVYAPPPPQPAYYPPQYQPPPPPRFQPAWVLGGRFGTLSPGKNSSLIGGSQNGTAGDDVPLKSYVGSGIALEADVGYHFAPSWTFYGFWEHGFLGKGDVNSGVSGDSSSNFVGLGFQANTNPRGPLGFYFDVGAGYRWLTLSYATGQTGPGADPRYANEAKRSVGGWEPLRIGIGAAIVVNPQFSLDVLLHASAGYFSKMDDSASPCSGSGDSSCGSIPVDRRAIHTFSGISVAAHWDLL